MSLHNGDILENIADRLIVRGAQQFGLLFEPRKLREYRCGIKADRRFFVVVLFMLLVGCKPTQHYDAALVLQDIAAAQGPSRLKQVTAAPLHYPISYEVSGRSRNGELYLPGKLEGCERTEAAINLHPAIVRGPGCPRAAIVLVPGAVPRGKDDPRLTAFAATLARAGFAVLTPDLAGFRELSIRPSDAREIADAFAYLLGRPDLARDERAGIIAFSYTVGPALLAALENDIRERVRFIMGVGGYHDLHRAMRFFTTGWFEHEGKWHYITPDDTGKMVLLYSSLGYLTDSRARDVFDRMVALRTRDPHADLTPLAAKLSADSRAVYELAAHTDPARFTELLARLPEAMRADISQLDLSRHDLKRLKARLILVHGMNDNLIPYPESLALAAAAPKGQAAMFLIHRVLGHVDLNIARVFSWQFWNEDLPDLWRLWRAIDLLLAQRQEAA
jgi:pimeloyl-ACP methyl ester carboxylesterase